MIARNRLFQLLCTIALVVGCKQTYEPPAIQLGVSALVVDGFLNNSADTTFIHLSHTNKLKDGVNNSQVNGAQLTIEDASGHVLYNFTQLNDSGIYIVPGMNLDANSKYRLRITADKEYLSDEIPVIKTPPVDSITFEHTGFGVNICSNAHDPLNNTHYYRWEYTETFQYKAAFFSGLVYGGGGSFRDRLPSEYIYECWKTQNNTQLLTATTTKLSQDIVYHNVVRFVEQNALELTIKYFIALRQFALTKEYFDYLQNLKKITEQTGSIFDAQPSQLSGNIHAVNNPNEVVLGYLCASTEEKSQLYITTEQVQPWKYQQKCAIVEIAPADVDAAFGSLNLIPLALDGGPYNLKGIFAATRPCGDCIFLAGGVTTKPAFWP